MRYSSLLQTEYHFINLGGYKALMPGATGTFIGPHVINDHFNPTWHFLRTLSAIMEVE